MSLNGYVRKRLAVVGCGPVGMLTALLLEKLNVDYVALEKFSSPRSHPSAHWLNANSKLIMSQLPQLTSAIDNAQQPWQYFQCYRYMESLFGYELGLTNHFQPSIQQKLANSLSIFGQKPNHIPQNILLDIMYQQLQDKTSILFNQQIKQIRKEQTSEENRYVLINQYNEPVVSAQYVILCSGANTHLRNNLLPENISPFKTQGHSNLMNVINVHFQSKNLSDALVKQKQNAMLHFIYGRKLIGILVNHSIERGVFVLQIPNYEPVVDLLSFYSGRELIAMIIDGSMNANELLKDLQVLHIGKWKLQGVLANTMHKNGIFLAGDAAHAFPPAGGFGMNCGFQDANELVHSLKMVLDNPFCKKQKIFEDYSNNRLKINRKYLTKSLQNYQITKNISSSLGYSANILDYFVNTQIFNTVFSFLPKPSPQTLQNLRLKAMELMYKRKKLDSPQLNLFFDSFEKATLNSSMIFKQIVKNSKGAYFNLYAQEGEITVEEIEKVYGSVETKNIKFCRWMGEDRLVNAAGTVLIRKEQ